MKHFRLPAFILILLVFFGLVLTASAAAVKSREDDSVIADGVWLGAN